MRSHRQQRLLERNDGLAHRGLDLARHATAKLATHPLQRLAKAVFAHRLQKIVDRAAIESTHRVLVVRGDEHQVGTAE